MTSPFKTKKFKALEQKWYKKLAESGFVDAEDTSREDMPLKAWHDQYFRRRYNVTTFAAKQSYYQRCQDFSHSYNFTDLHEKRVWDLHCEGVSVREIGKKLRCGKDEAHEIIFRLRKECFRDSSD